MVRQIQMEGARISVTRGKVPDVHPDAKAPQIDCAARELQCGDRAVRCHFPCGAFVYGNVCGRARAGHGCFTGPDASSVERNIGRTALVVELACPMASSVEGNARSTSLVAEATVPAGRLIEIRCQLPRESFQRLRGVILIQLHAIEHVTVQDRLVKKGKIHDSFVVHGVIRCACQRGVPAGVDCVQRVIPFGFQISFLLRIVAGKSQIDCISFRKCILSSPAPRILSYYFCVAGETAALA